MIKVKKQITGAAGAGGRRRKESRPKTTTIIMIRAPLKERNDIIARARTVLLMSAEETGCHDRCRKKGLKNLF